MYQVDKSHCTHKTDISCYKCTLLLTDLLSLISKLQVGRCMYPAHLLDEGLFWDRICNWVTVACHSMRKQMKELSCLFLLGILWECHLMSWPEEEDDRAGKGRTGQLKEISMTKVQRARRGVYTLKGKHSILIKGGGPEQLQMPLPLGWDTIRTCKNKWQPKLIKHKIQYNEAQHSTAKHNSPVQCTEHRTGQHSSPFHLPVPTSSISHSQIPMLHHISLCNSLFSLQMYFTL